MCVFAVKIYLKAWIKAPIPAAVPNNDLKLLKSIQAYTSINSAVSKSCNVQVLFTISDIFSKNLLLFPSLIRLF